MFKSINIKDLKIQDKYESLFRRSTIEESSIWLKHIYLFTCFFIAILLLLSITDIISQTIYINIIMLGILVAYLVLIGLLHFSQKTKKRILQEVIVNAMYVFTMLSTGSLAVFGFAHGTYGQLLLYALGLFISSIMVIRHPLVTIIVYIIVHFIFTITLFITTAFEGIYLNDQISLFLFVFVAIIVSVIRYNLYKKNFIIRIKMQELNNSLKNLSSEDSLTKLNNRKKTNEELEKAIESSNRYKNPLTVMMIDIDHFNEINNQYGHKIADQVLIDAADIFCSTFRNSDIIGRWRGEAFLVLCINTTAKLGKKIAERILQMIDMNEFDDVFSITVSIGMSEFVPGEGADEIIMRADTALYKAKSLGHNRVEIE